MVRLVDQSEGRVGRLWVPAGGPETVYSFVPSNPRK